MEIDIETLTTCEVAADGGAISLGFVDSAGEPATVTLSLNNAGSLAMTLPGLITKALQTRFGDRSLYNAYPLASWAVEQSSDPALVLERCEPLTASAPASRSSASSKPVRRGTAGRACIQRGVPVNEISSL